MSEDEWDAVVAVHLKGHFRRFHGVGRRISVWNQPTSLPRCPTRTERRPVATVCDVTIEDDVQNLVANAVECLGGIDVMMNNAGLGYSARLADTIDEKWSAVIGVTLDGPLSVIGWRAQEE